MRVLGRTGAPDAARINLRRHLVKPPGRSSQLLVPIAWAHVRVARAEPAQFGNELRRCVGASEIGSLIICRNPVGCI